MRCIVQKVSAASVKVGERGVAAIGRGLLVLVGVERADSDAEAVQTAEKLATLRCFEDRAGKMNLGPAEAAAAFLLVPQFTLAGDPLARGRRPSFDGAADPAAGRRLFARLVEELRQRGFAVETGEFGARMAVELVNDGPVTFVLDVPQRRG
jgi:D-tyrosyl-tRNA(Tyr) deacylase